MTYGNPDQLSYPQLNGETVTATKKNSQGDIEEFQLQSGKIVSYQDAVTAVSSGNAKGLLVQKGNDGEQILRSAPDAHKENNLDNLPNFE
jgi:hypothetical protein